MHELGVSVMEHQAVPEEGRRWEVTGYCKVFQSILGSSIWAATDAELRTWIAMLVLKDRNHIVKMSVVGLANIARVTVEQCREALEKFKAPDPESTNKANEGRKIRELPEGGWIVLNGEYYAKMLSYEERREYNKQKQAEYRKRRKDVVDSGAKAGAVAAINEGLTPPITTE